MSNPKGIRAEGKDIFTVNFADYLPDVLKHDPKMKSLAEAVSEQFIKISKNIDSVLIYSRIDELPEELIDILAYDMHVDWYDYSFPLNIKKAVLKSSVKVHKKMGTKYAVETALKALYPKSKIEEWFEYGGEPYHFRVILNAENENIQINMKDIEKEIRMYKRLSAHLDSINIERVKKTSIFVAAGKEMFVKQKINRNPYNKILKTRITMKVASCNLCYVKLYYGRQ